MAHPHWPLWDIRVRTPRLELRPAHEPDIPALIDLISRGLGAIRAETSAYVETIASQRVTEKLGYSPDGWYWETVRNERRRTLRFALDREDWPGRDDVVIEGLGPEALDQFGLS